MNNSGREYAFLNFMEERLKKVVQNKKEGYKKLKINENDTIETIAKKFEKYATGPNKEYNNIYFELDGIYISSAECKAAERVIEIFQRLQHIRTVNFDQYYSYDNKKISSNLLFNGKSAEHKLEIISNIKNKYKPENVTKENVNQQNNNEIDTIDIPIFNHEKEDNQQNNREKQTYGMDNIDIPIEFENDKQTRKQTIKTQTTQENKTKNQKVENFVIEDIDISIEPNDKQNIKSNTNSTKKIEEMKKYNYKNYYEENFESLDSEKQNDIIEKNTNVNTGELFDTLVGYVDYRHMKLMSKKEKLEFIINSDLKTLNKKREELENKISEYDMSIEMYNDNKNIKNILGDENKTNIKNIIENNSLNEIKEQERNLKEELEELEFAIEKKKNDKMQYFHRKYGKVVDELSKIKKLKINKFDYLKYNTKTRIKNIMTHNLDLTSIKEMCKRKLLKNKTQEEIKESYTNGK